MSFYIQNKEDFKELRELMCMLRKCSVEEESAAAEWFDNLVRAFGLKSNAVIGFTALGYLTEKEKAGLERKYVTHLTEALHEPLVKHNWSEALHVLVQSNCFTNDAMHIAWKVGCELISQEPDQSTRCTLMRDFYLMMKKEHILNQKTISIDYALFALYNDNIAYAKSVFQDLYLKGSVEKSELCDYLCEAYQGMIYYLEWKKCKSQMETQQNLTDPDGSFFFMSQEKNYEMQADQFASKALGRFNLVEQNEGIWDIFVEQYVEILVSCDRQNDALQVVKDYSKHHENHLTAQKFLYSLYRDHFPELKGEMIQVLKVIADLSPADPLVLEYCKLVGDASEITSRLFTLLDYPIWQSEVKPWKMMANSLERICIHKKKGTEDAMKVVKQCWKVRETWWPSFHFTKYTEIKDSHNLTLLRQKYLIASMLCKTDNTFAVMAKEKLREARFTQQNEHVFKKETLSPIPAKKAKISEQSRNTSNQSLKKKVKLKT